jgi:hypothetical protein
MLDILTFDKFIAKEFFIIFYYMGAIFMPFFIIFNRLYLRKRFNFIDRICNTLLSLFKKLPKKEQIKSVIFMFILFVILEIFWRVAFEFIIGYFKVIENLELIKILLN